MGFIDYLRSLINKIDIHEEDRLNEISIRANKHKMRALKSSDCNASVSGNKQKSSNLVSKTTTTTIINHKKISKIVKSSYVKSKTNEIPRAGRHFRISSPIAESSCLFSRNFQSSATTKKTHAIRKGCKCSSKLRNNPRQIQHARLNKNALGNDLPSLEYCKNRNKYYMYEMAKKKNSSYGNKFKMRTGKIRHCYANLILSFSTLTATLLVPN